MDVKNRNPDVEVAYESDSSGLLFIRPLTDFLHKEASAGILLVIGAAVAMIWANSPWSGSYTDLWGTHAVIGLGDFNIELTLQEWINDAAMVLFFFVAGLEIKRELTQGELRDPRQAALPIIAAFGGMIVPALIFYGLNVGTDAGKGWGIPMATDIAVVMGVVSLLGTRAPSWLKLFLLALAIVDDIGAIIVIAIFYSEGVSFTWLALAVAALATAMLIRSHVNFLGVYLVLGVICWLGLHEAHVHTTLAGVAFGLLAPVTPQRNIAYVDADQLAAEADAKSAHLLAAQARGSVSVVEWLTHKLHPYSAWIVVPIFALANAGVKIPTENVGETLSSRVTWGVILGLVVGKTVGVAGATLLAAKLKIGTLPELVTTRYVIGAAALAGIGFTVSLFVTELAFGHGDTGTEARIGVLIASLVAAAIGTAICIPGHVDED
ncbi:MAG TPA: Na+/H+ antiporter NhaA [Ilumatobacter sp.]|nr:Na+/H+ antiporter NhaA [Ilumatobacter sp.]